MTFRGARPSRVISGLVTTAAAVVGAACSDTTPRDRVGADASTAGVRDAATAGRASSSAPTEASVLDVSGDPGPDARARADANASHHTGTIDARRPIQTPTFRKVVLTNAFYAEGASYGDFDRNGAMDVVSGPYWYEGPAFTTKHVIYTPVEFDLKSYSDNFLEFVRDFDGDGYPDVLIVNFPGKDASVYANPQGRDMPWERHPVVSAVDIESPAFTDVDGDGAPELVFAAGGRIGWAGPNVAAPYDPWAFHAATPVAAYTTFTHGLGVGDVDGDGRVDLLEAGGYWKQPPSLANDPLWTQNAQNFGSGGAQMFAYDVDGDGDRDIVTSLAAHEYGIAWFEQRGFPAATFARHLVATDDPADAGESVLVFQPHALDAADIDGDGLRDIVTGERFWGHVPPGDPSPDAPAKLYWFGLEQNASGARFTPHLVDDESGVGTQVVAADVDGDALVDIVTASKKGAFVFLQRRN